MPRATGVVPILYPFFHVYRLLHVCMLCDVNTVCGNDHDKCLSLAYNSFSVCSILGQIESASAAAQDPYESVQFYGGQDHDEIHLCNQIKHINNSIYYAPNPDISKYEAQFLGYAKDHIEQGQELLDRIGASKLYFEIGLPSCPLKASTNAFVASSSCAYFPKHQVSNAYIYLDGGFKEDADVQLTWAIALVLESHNELFEVKASQSGRIGLDPTSADFLGQEGKPDSFMSELYAQIMARIFIHQHMHQFVPHGGIPIHIVYDNAAACFASESAFISNAQPAMSQLCTTLDKIVKSEWNVTSSHIHSHLDHPLNELVDAMCTHARSHAPSVCFLPFAPITKDAIKQLELVRTFCVPHVRAQVTTPYFEGAQWQRIPSDIIASKIDHDSPVPPFEQFNCLHVNHIQYNVRSMSKSHMRKSLLALLAHNKIFSACLEEVREKKSGIYERGDYFCCIAAAENGNYGCSVYVSKVIPYAYKAAMRVCVSKHNLSIFYDTPRLLVVIVSAPAYKWAYVAGHAPHGTGGHVLEWWENFVHIYNKVFAITSCIVCGIDGNTTFQPNAFSKVGTVTSKRKSPNSAEITKVIQDLPMYAISTCEEYCKSDFAANPHTYITKTGKDKSVIDYMCVSDRALGVMGSIFICNAMLIGTFLNDHYPLMGQIVLRPNSNEGVPNARRKIGFDDSKIGDPISDEIFFKKVLFIQGVEYNVDQVSHCHLIDTEVVNAACEAYPITKKGPGKKQAYISQPTFNKIVQRNSVLRDKLRAYVRFSLTCLFYVFHVWSHRKHRIRHIGWSPVFAFNAKEGLSRYVVADKELRNLNVEVPYCVTLERIDRDVSAADSLEEAIINGNMYNIHQALGPIKPNKKQCSVGKRVHDEFGVPAVSIVGEKVIMRKYFAGQLEGIETTFQDIIDKDRSIRISVPNNLSAIDVLNNLPTHHYCQLFRSY